MALNLQLFLSEQLEKKLAFYITIQSITDISTEEDFRKTKTMSRSIFCLVFVAVLASIGYGRVIEKRSPSFYDYYEYNNDNTYNPKMNPVRLNPTQSPGVADFGGQIDNAIDAVGDFGSDAIDEINDNANSDAGRRVGNRVVDVGNDVGDAFVGHLFG